MKRLRHPVRAIREPFGTAGLVVACVALIAALGGTALAAAKLNSKQKKEVEKIAKKFAGKPGAPGAQGPAGPQGPAGANGKDGVNGSAGAQGATGPTGKTGPSGVTGAAGSSPEIVAEGSSLCSGKGGVVYEVEGSGEEAEVCNGEKGKEGSPWTAGGTLPPGATETGTWSFVGTSADSGGIYAPISFPIRLAAEIDAQHAIYEKGAINSPCKGTPGNPKAEPGYLCVYPNSSGAEPEPTQFEAFCNPTGYVQFTCIEEHETESMGASSSGSILVFSAPASGVSYGTGTFAVTAPVPSP